MEATTIIFFLLGVAIGSGVMYYICRSTSKSVDLDNNLISNNEAIELLNNRVRTDLESVSGHLPLDVLLSYFDYISKESEANLIELSGFEFYFGEYGEREDRRESNKMTFFLYPTVNIDGHHVPFDPIASRVDGIVRLVDIMADGNNGENLVALNRSNMSPPRGQTIL